MKRLHALSEEPTAPERWIGFAPESEVDVRQDGDREWKTLRTLTYHGKSDTFEVPLHQATDFASVPRVFAWLIPVYGRYTKAAILHDYLCRVAVEADVISRADADGIFRQAMRTLEVAFLRRWIMWTGVRLGALATAKGREKWLGHSWQVVPVVLVALPLVMPAAGVIIVSLAGFYLVERVAWLALLVGKHRRRSAGKPAKQVNEPRLQLKL
ncbi:MAG: DUF1353 domain-containing protein [Umezawaea sp.]